MMTENVLVKDNKWHNIKYLSNVDADEIDVQIMVDGKPYPWNTRQILALCKNLSTDNLETLMFQLDVLMGSRKEETE